MAHTGRRVHKTKLKPSEELRLRCAKLLGEMITCEISLAVHTEPWWRWTCGLSIALILERYGPIK